MKCLTLSLVILSGISATALAQGMERIYKLENGTIINKTQLDSLNRVYNNVLNLTYARENGKMIITVKLPADSLSGDKSGPETPLFIPAKMPDSTGFGASAGRASFHTAAGDSLEEEKVFLDTEGNEISEEAFKKLLADTGVHAQYSISIADGKKKVTMRPSIGEDAQELTRKMQAMNEALYAMMGKPFPFDPMTDMEGNVYSAQQRKGKIVVLNYWFVECAPCIREMPFLNELAAEYSHRDDILFLAPSLSDRAKILNMLEERPFDYTLIPDAGTHSQNVGISAFPTNIVVDRSGNVSFVEIGYHDDTVEKLRQDIEKLLSRDPD